MANASDSASPGSHEPAETTSGLSHCLAIVPLSQQAALFFGMHVVGAAICMRSRVLDLGAPVTPVVGSTIAAFCWEGKFFGPS